MDVDCRTCGDPQSRHKLGKGGCRGCDIGCARFEPETAAEPVEPVPADELVSVADDAVPYTSARPMLSFDAVNEQLREVERERDEARAAVADVEGERKLTAEQRDEAERARDELAVAVDRLQERLGEASDLLTAKRAELEQMGEFRAEAIATVREVAGERDAARGDLATEVEAHRKTQLERNQYRAQVEQLDKSLAKLEAPSGLDALLAQADATEVPAIVQTGDSIRDLITQLREQLADHERLDALRVELGQLEERAAVIRSELAEAEKPLPPVVPDKTIRDWARKNGFEVDARGRIPVWLRGQYLQAHTG
jgi:hypothetical protein